LLPIADWLPRYDRSWLRGDLTAGIAVTALVVPKNLGYAGIAGVPIENGLYAAAAGAIIYALFCTSRQISTGPSSSLAAVAGGAVLVTKLGGQEAAQLVAAITLVTGALFLLLALFRMGWIAQFLSKAVITGFLAGAAIDVTIGELPKLTGTSSSGDSAWRELATWIQGLGEMHWTTLVVGLVSLGVILGLRFAAPAVPGALVLVVGGLIASGLFDLGTHGVALVGHVPRGLPSPALPDWDLVRTHLSTIGIASVALLLIGFSQTAGDARAFATRHRYRIDVNQESVAQGMANVGAGVFQGMPVSTSLSASSLNESAGARTPVASLITGGLVLLTLIVLAPLFSSLPKAVLAAVIIDAVIFGMIDVGELRRLHRVARVDFWIAAAAIFGVLSAGVLAGVVIVFNDLIAARNQVRAAWSDIDVQLTRRHDLVPQLVAAVQGYASYERATLTTLTELRARAVSAASLADKAEVEGELAKQIDRILALQERYPDLKASENFLALQRELVEIEDHLQYARRFYNGAVRDLNTKIETFPALIIARAAAFKPAEFFRSGADQESQV